MGKARSESLIPVERIAAQIYVIRGLSVMLDSDLAGLYGVTTKALNQQVTRNMTRFPEDFAFHLTREEFTALRSQIVTLKTGRGQHPKYSPRVFTEHGILMLSSVLRSDRAAAVNVAIMRTFVRLRRILGSNEELARKVAQHDEEIGWLVERVQELMEPPEPPEPAEKRPIGFRK